MTDTLTTMPTTQPAPGQATRRYLRALQHRRADPVDWRAAPAPYKRYPPAGRVVLPWTPAPAAQPTDPQLALLGTLLRDLLGLRTAWAHPTSLSGLPTGAPPGVAVKRPAPSGGALYPIEAYLATSAGPGRAAALHHYDAAHHCLDLIRAGDHRAAFTSLLAAPPPALPDLVLVLTAVFWRNGFKYGDFAYRLQCQETGVLTAQALALAETWNLTGTVHLNFADHHTQALLGLEPTCEGPLAILTFTTKQTAHTDTRPQTPHHPSYADLIARPAIEADNPPPSVTELLPHLTALHTAAAHRPSDVPEQDIAPPARPERHEDRTVRLPQGHWAPLADGIASRTSAPTGYLPTALGLESLAAVLTCAAAGYPGDLPSASRAPVSVTPYVLVLRVADITPGAYHYDTDTHTLTPVGDANAVAAVAQGPLHTNTRHALGEAAAVLLPVGDPLEGTPRLGDRWYRIQQIETGLMVHHATLAATARRLATRIHSDGANHATDAALGLHATLLRSLSFLLFGHQRPGPVLRGHDSSPSPLRRPRRD